MAQIKYLTMTMIELQIQAGTNSRGFVDNVLERIFLNENHVIFINPLRATFFRGNINIYLHFMSLLHIDMTQVLKIVSQVRPGPTFST